MRSHSSLIISSQQRRLISLNVVLLSLWSAVDSFLFTFTSLGISSVTTPDHNLFFSTHPVGDNFSSQLTLANTHPTQQTFQRSFRSSSNKAAVSVVAVANDGEFASLVIHALPPCLLTVSSALYHQFRPPKDNNNAVISLFSLSQTTVSLPPSLSTRCRLVC
jgi:hypothetical protein